MMRHADDGTLHALLDGALWAESPERAEEVEAHLDGCADCRARFDRAADLRDRAGSILAAAEPAAPLPDFGEVLARRAAGAGAGGAGGADATGDAVAAAERARLRRRVRRVRGLAWAASLVIALGTGYLVGDRFGFAPHARRQASEVGDRIEAEAVEDAASEGLSEDAAADGDQAGVTRSRREAQRQAAAEGAPVRAAGPQPTPVTGRATPQEPDAGVAADVARPADATRSADVARPAEAERVASEPEPSGREVPLPAAPPPAPVRSAIEPSALYLRAPARAPSEEAASPEDASRLLESGLDWRDVDVDSARELMGGELMVLPEARVGSARAAVAAAAVVVETAQRLPGDVVVQVQQLRRSDGRPALDGIVATGLRSEKVAAAEEEAEVPVAEAPTEAAPATEALADAARGTESVTVDAGVYRLVVRGPLPARVLRDLALRARPAGGR